MAGIILKNIYKQYNEDETAVKDFNLEIDDKEFIVLVGPSGCGKSTTLRMIAGLEEITSGELYIGDRLVNDVVPKDRDIAMVFQNYALYPHMNVYDNMAFGLKLRKFKKDEIAERVNSAAKILGIESLLHRKPKELSGGQRQRVALGRAIVREPQAFLMDEPLSNLDAKLRVQMRSEISKLHKRLQSTIVYVTHDQTEAMTMASRIVVMKDGVIQQIGSPKEVYDEPNNVFVGGFIGGPPMNFFQGTLDSGNIVIGETRLALPERQLNTLRETLQDGDELIMGLRPEDFNDDEQSLAKWPGSTIEAHIDVAELMGAEIYLHSTLEGVDYTARVDAKSDVLSGQTIKLALDMSKTHFFNLETEERIR